MATSAERRTERHTAAEVRAEALAAGETKTGYPHIVCTPGMVGGRPRIEGTRLPVWQIANLWNKRETLENLLDMYPDLTPAAVFSALAYYWDHKAEIDTEIEENRPENTLAWMRQDPDWVEEPAGRFRFRPAKVRHE